MAKNRLSSEDWLAAGFRALSSHGPAALKAEPLARALGTTKGSFYWHFADVPSFHAAMLALWEARAFEDVTAELETETNPVKRLRALGNVAAAGTPKEFGGDGTEPAMRAWSRENSTVAQAIQRVDARRMRYIADILAEIGLTNSDLSRLVYGAYIGMQDLTTRDATPNVEAMGTLIDLILALYETE
ncbi:TetR/AcrR family transcriptional regulator [Cognatishimia sp. WU-CL00825]|uniref:TetR/AcrR family transcriptional regulator n=1 Tax=Cognatishimia sp. WU-CL00825 TaxID=3127658 RepID=UPI0031074E86